MKVDWASMAVLAGTASALVHRPGMEVGPLEGLPEQAVDGVDGFNGWGTFEQLLDHSNPALGTFKQRFWYGSQFWKGSGSPIFLICPGEQPADRFNTTYTTNNRLPGRMANVTGGAVIILEHRYWGQSSPFEELTVANLEYLTLDNSLKDLTYFAHTFVPPFDTTGGSAPSEAPWVFSGGSYPGALAGWHAHLEPGTFWAYHGTSGVVEAVSDFWQYYDIVEEATPQNCSVDTNNVINLVDSILQGSDEGRKDRLKAKFGLAGLQDADFSGALVYGPGNWQSGQFYTVPMYGYNEFYRWCDYVEGVWPNSTNPVPGPEGVGTCKALDNYAKWFKEYFLPGFCESFGYDDFQGENNIACFAYLNSSSPWYTDLSPSNQINRQWWWMLCNEPFEWWQDGAPLGHRTLVSRLVNVEYARTQCGYLFPASQGGLYGLEEGKTVETENAYTGGWSVTNTKRLMYANGQYDPWRDATVSADDRPGGPLQSTPDTPVRLIPGGIHCSDYYSPNWDVNPGVAAIAADEVAQMAQWISEFTAAKTKRRAIGWTG